MERIGLRPLSRVAAAALALAVGVLASPARAQGGPTAAAAPSSADLARARAHFAQGESAAAAGRWDVAIDRFEKVLAIKETPGVVFHLAAAHEGAGHLAKALELFERARSIAAAGGVEDVLTLSEARIAALGHRVPRLVVRVPAPGESTAIRLDGAPLPEDRWGEAMRLDPGAHRVEAVFRGEPFVRAIELTEGTWLTVVVGDAAAPTSTPAPAPPAAPAPTALPATGLTTEAPAPEAAGPPWGPIALGAGGLALAAGGVVTFVVAGAESSSAADACAAGSCDPGARDTVRALDVASLALWITGGAAVAGAAVWWSLDDTGAPTIEARVAPGRATLVGRF